MNMFRDCVPFQWELNTPSSYTGTLVRIFSNAGVVNKGCPYIWGCKVLMQQEQDSQLKTLPEKCWLMEEQRDVDTVCNNGNPLDNHFSYTALTVELQYLFFNLPRLHSICKKYVCQNW
jgi:hypothetical protein